MSTISRQLNSFNALKEAIVGPIPDLFTSILGARSLRHAPRGDGHTGSRHPVLVLPGFLSGDGPTWPLRHFLTGLGYRAWPWGLGLNLGFSTSYHYDIEALIEHRLKEIYLDASDQKISIIGWSLGGVYAREMARNYPNLIKEVITLGSPISGNPGDTSITGIYSWVTQMPLHDPTFQEKILKSTAPVPNVPVTAFYSLSDNIVPPQCAMETPGPLTESIEVDCTHTGFGFNAQVFFMIAHRLAQQSQPWSKLDVDAVVAEYSNQRSPFSFFRPERT
jgi:pimeloyl-ACP methyl ester carboxylesterase